MKFGSDRNRAEALEGVNESVGEAVQAVSVLDDTVALDVVKDFADLFRGEFVMIQEFDEARDGALEVDVVLPEGVVGVDQKRLAGRKTEHEFHGIGRPRQAHESDLHRPKMLVKFAEEVNRDRVLNSAYFQEALSI